MPEENSIADNMQKGRGIMKGKDGFEVVGADASDRKHPLIEGEAGRGRGRPTRDQNFTEVGQTVEEEQSDTASS